MQVCFIYATGSTIFITNRLTDRLSATRLTDFSLRIRTNESSSVFLNRLLISMHNGGTINSPASAKLVCTFYKLPISAMTCHLPICYISLSQIHSQFRFSVIKINTRILLTMSKNNLKTFILPSAVINLTDKMRMEERNWCFILEYQKRIKLT